MAIRTFNSVGGFSVGEVPSTIILPNGDITTDFATFTANVEAGNVLTNNLLYANGVAWDFISAGGTNTQIQFNDNNELGGTSAFTFNKAGNILTLTGNANIGNINTTGQINATGNVTAPYFIGDVVGNISGQITVPGSNTAVLFNNQGNAGASDALKFNFASNVLTVLGNVTANYFKGDGSELTNINGANVTGNVGNAVVAYTAYAIDGANVNGNVSSAVVAYSAYAVDGANVNGNVSSAVLAYSAYSVDGANVNGTVDTAQTVTTNAQPNITSVGTLTSLIVSGTGNIGNLYVNERVTSNLIPSNDNTLTLGNSALAWKDVFTTNVNVGTAYIRSIGNVLQVDAVNVANNLTSGTLTSSGDADLQGNVTVAGNLTVSGTTTYINVTELSVNDPIISLGGSNSGGNASTYDGKDRGLWLRNYSNVGSDPINMFMGWDTSASQFALGSNVSVSGEVVTFNSYGNIKGEAFIGNLSGTVLTASQTNITTVGTLTDLTIAGNLQVNTSANLNSLTAGGLSYPTADGSAGQVMTTYGNGVLHFTSISSSSITNGTSNVNVVNNGNVNISSAGTANVLAVTSTGVNVSGTFNSTGSATVGNVILGNSSIRSVTVPTSTALKSTLVSISATGNRAVEFFVKGEDSTGGKYSVATVSAVHDGANVDYAVYGTVILGGATGVLEVNYATGTITLDVTPASSNQTIWTIQYRTI